MYKRVYYEDVKRRVNEGRKFIQVLMGPRQVGKTTLMKQVLEDTSIPYTFESADAVPAAQTNWLVQVWESARMQMKTRSHNEYLLVIDEIQKLANWSEIVKQQWDKDSRENVNLKVILLGSSRLLLQRGLTESLAGRFETIHLGHWSFSEMREAFGWTVEQYVYFGGYPGSADLITDEQRWKNYVNDALIETSISKDVLMLTRVDKPALLRQLFELGSEYSGQILSFTKIVGQLQDAGNTTTLANYLQLLSDCGLLTGLEKYAGDIIRKRSSSPKFQVFNNALLTAQSNLLYMDVVVDAKEWGRLVESSVGAHLVNYSIQERFHVYYWREDNKEVDFILEKNGQLIALEVKSGLKCINTGMALFIKKYNPQSSLFVGTGGIPYADFLCLNPVDLFK